MNENDHDLPIQGFIEQIDVIDTDNNVVGKVTMHEVHAKKLPHRCSHVLIFNITKDQIFLQKRGPKVFIYPDYWTSSASGHVKSGQTYQQAAILELLEELGVECDLKYIGYYWIDEGDNIERNAVYVGYCDGPFFFKEKDVPGGEWFDTKYLKDNYLKIKTCPYFRATYNYYLSKFNS